MWIHNACTDIIDIWDMHVQRNTVENSTLNMNFFCEAHYFNTPGWPFWSRMNCKTESIHLYRISRRMPKNMALHTHICAQLTIHEKSTADATGSGTFFGLNFRFSVFSLLSQWDRRSSWALTSGQPTGNWNCLFFFHAIFNLSSTGALYAIPILFHFTALPVGYFPIR